MNTDDKSPSTTLLSDKASIKDTNNTIKINYYDLYKLITLILLIFIVIFSYYFSYIKLFSPLLIFIAIYSIRIIKINNLCTKGLSGKESLPYMKLFHRTILLICVYLYSEYTVKCIPILDLVFNRIFDFPITGKILKCFFSYLFLEFADKIINNIQEYNNIAEDDIIEDDICKINDSNQKLSLTIIILAVIICNTYIDDAKNYFKNN
jgi:hypothetical protein